MSWFTKAIKSCGKAAGTVVKTATKPAALLGKEITKIPIVGKPLNAVYNLSVNAPFKLASNIASGQRIDKAVVGHFKGQLADAKTVAPYAQTVVSFVPGIGQGVSGAIGAGLALAEGRPINEALVSAVKGAIPGGPAAQAAFSIAAAAAQGKPIDEIAISALPLDENSKKALRTVTSMTKDLASGKRVDEALLNSASKALPSQYNAALKTAVAVAAGKNLQDTLVKNVGPEVLKTLAKEGCDITAKNPVMKAGADLLKGQKSVKAGFDVGVAFASKKVRPIDLVAVRKKLKGPQRKGFDMALAAHIGMVTRPPTKSSKHPPASQFGYYVTHGMRQAAPKHKVAMMKEVAKDPIARTGAVTAVKEVQWVDAPWWKKLLSDLGIHVGPKV
jgi:hypothetical protein